MLLERICLTQSRPYGAIGQGATMKFCVRLFQSLSSFNPKIWDGTLGWGVWGVIAGELHLSQSIWHDSMLRHSNGAVFSQIRLDFRTPFAA